MAADEDEGLCTNGYNCSHPYCPEHNEGVIEDEGWIMELVPPATD
jgi:hypothetical protein